MKIARLLVICALSTAAALGCSSANQGGGGGGFPGSGSGDNGSSEDGGTQQGVSGGSSGGATSSGASSSGGTGSGSSGGGSASSASDASAPSDASGGIITTDGAPVDNPEIDYSGTQTITMATFQVPAGEEVYYCQQFADPWSDQVDIKTYELSMSAGSHHMFAFYQTDPTPASTATPCPSGGLTFGAFTFTAQVPKVTQTYPATIGATIPAGTGFNMMAHYLNTTSGTLNAVVSLTMYIAKPNVVTNHAGVIFLNNAAISVPATGQPVVTTDSYTLPQDVEILTASSHMHKFATNFVATTSTGLTLYTTTQWDNPPPETYSPPLALTSGTTITWSCTDVNDTGATLTFGESAQTNVMCIDVNIFYPVADVTNPVLGSAISGILGGSSTTTGH